MNLKLTQTLWSIFLLIALIAFSGCKEEKEEINITDSESWKTVNAEGIIVEVPENWQYQRLPGTDSHVGLLTNNQDSLEFDFGWYSNKLEVDPASYSILQERVDGKPAKIIKTMLPGEIPFGIHVDSVRLTSSGTFNVVHRFTMVQTSSRQMGESKVFRIFRSLKF